MKKIFENYNNLTVQKRNYNHYINAITSKCNKIVYSTLAGLILIGGISTPAEASASGSSIEVEIRNTSRGLFGNAQGTARVRRATTSATSAIRGRVSVQRLNNGSWIGAGLQDWHRFDNPPNNTWRYTVHFEGTHRSNTRVRAQGQRLATANGSWSTTVTHTHTY